MPRHAACLLAAFGLLAGASSARAAVLRPPERAASSRILGRVIDAKSRAGIGSVQVRLDGGAADVTTAADGAFEFGAVEEGKHQLVAVLAGFAASSPVTVDVRAGADANVELEYSLGVTTEVLGAAQEPPASPPKVSLGTAEMSGAQVAAAVGGLDDVSRVMQLRPGVTPSQDDRNDLMVRGGGAYETSVRVDGFEIPTGSHFSWPGSAGGGLSLIPSAVIQRVSLDTSGFSVAHGERASALMSVDTRTGARDAIRGRFDVTAGGVMGLAEGRLPGPSGNTGSWLASARQSILQIAFSRGDTRATPSYTEVMGNIDLPLSKTHRLHVLGLGSADRLDVDWQSTSSTTITGDQHLAATGVRLDSTWSPGTQTALSAGWVSNRASLGEVQQTLTSFTDRSHEHFLRARAEVVQRLARGVRVRTGVAVKHSDVEFYLQDGSYRNEWNIVVPGVHSTWTDTYTDAAGYADGTWTAGRAELGAGVRGDHSGFNGKWYASPRARFEYRPTARWRLTAAWGEYRQDIPNIWIGSNAANRTLDPIRCLQATVGVEGGLWSGAWMTVEGFSKRYSGYPIDPAVPSRVLVSAGSDFESPLVGKLVPSGLVHADGADSSLSQQFGHQLTLSVGYSYWDVSQYNLEKKWIPADYDIRHQARVWAVWHGARNWTASALWRYAAGRPYTPYDVAASIKANAGRYDRTKTNAVNYSPYRRLDLRVERVFAFKRSAITVFAEVDNLDDHDNIYMYEWSRSLKQARPILQWGITPIAGIRVEY
jgi:hypothetical protein